MLHQFRREGQAVQEQAEAVMALAREQGFAQLVGSRVSCRGWALAAQGQGEEGMAQMRQGLAAYRATGAELGTAVLSGLLAEAYGTGGQAEEGLRVLAEALAAVHNTGERWYEAELYRLKGDLLLALSADHQAEAEACFQQALAVARRQQAKSWELRAAMSLSRLWQQPGQAGRSPRSCWPRSTAGSPRALTPPTSRRPRRC